MSAFASPAVHPLLIDHWLQQYKLTAEDGAAGDFFGYSVAVFGDTALVGAANAHVDGNSDQGAAYVFLRNGSIWGQQETLVTDDGAALDLFGLSVALSGDTALVGAFRANVGGNPGQRAAYVFTRSGTTWSQQAKLTTNDGAAKDDFGF